MRKINLLSGRTRTRGFTELDEDRYEFLNLENAEPNLGTPDEDNGIAGSNLDGSRKWLYPKAGLLVNDQNEIIVDEDTIAIDTQGFFNTISDNLHDVLVDFDTEIASMWITVTANYTAESGDKIIADTSGGTFTITLPSSPMTGAWVRIVDPGVWSITNSVTVGRNGSTIEGLAEDYVISDIDVQTEFVYNGTTWEVFRNDKALQAPGTDRQVIFNDDGKLAGSEIYFDTAGNVGIDTATPTQKLDVNGNIVASGSIIALGTGVEANRFVISTSTGPLTGIIYEGDADEAETFITFQNPTADRTITVPDADGTFTVSVSNTSTTNQGDLNLNLVLNSAGNLSITGDAHNLGITDTPSFNGIAIDSTIVFDPDFTTGGVTTTLQFTTPTTDRTINIPDADGVIAVSVTDTTTGVQGELNLDLLLNSSGNLSVTGTAQGLSESDSPTFNTVTADVLAADVIRADGTIVFEGATANDFETTITATDPTADRTITVPDADGIFAVSVSDTSAVNQGELNLDFVLNPSGNVSASGTALSLGSTDSPTFNNLTLTGLFTANNFADSILVLNADENLVPSEDVGIEVERGTETNVRFFWDESEDYWSLENESLNLGGLFINGQQVINDDGSVQIITDDTINGSGTVASPYSVVKWANAIDLTLEGEIEGTASIDGSSNITITTTDPNTFEFTKTLTLTDSWLDVGISSTDLDTGTYILQIYMNNGAVGNNVNEYLSGIMSWYNGTTNPVTGYTSDEIPLHRAGEQTQANIFLRTFRSSQLSGEGIKLQIFATTPNTGPSSYVFKFKKLI